MKKHQRASVYSTINLENNFLLFAINTLCATVKKDFRSAVIEFELLSKEKLPIIYANIRV